MKHKLFSLITAFPLLLSVILAGFTPAQATPSNSNQDYILSGKIFLDGKLATLDSESLEWFSIGAGEQGSISKADGTYSIKVPVDVKLISFCYTTKGDLPYNTNSSHCSYLGTSLITIKTGDSPLTYSYDFYFNTTPGRMITGSITSPEKKVNGSYLTTYVKVYGEQGILESMNVFGNKYQISIPQIAKRITFCKAGMVCIELNPKSALFNSNNALLSFNLNFKKAVNSAPVIVTSDTKKTTLVYGYLLQPDGSPATYASIDLFPSTWRTPTIIQFHSELSKLNSQTPSKEVNEKIKSSWAKFTAYLNGSEYQSLPEYTTSHTYSSDENGMITMSIDIDHYSGNAHSCNLNSCYPVAYPLFNDTKTHSFPNQGSSLLFYGISNQYIYADGPDDPAPVSLKPGLSLKGKLLGKFSLEQFRDYTGYWKTGNRYYFSPGAYLSTYDRDGKFINKTTTDSKGNYSLTLPDNFYKMDICDVTGKCQSVTTYDKYYYLTLDPKKAEEMTPYTFPAPTNRIGTLKGILYDNKKKKVSPNSKIYLFNDKQKLISTLTTNTRGEFTTSLIYIQSNKIARIQGCIKVGECDYNHVRASEVQAFISEGINFPFQVVKRY